MIKHRCPWCGEKIPFLNIQIDEVFSTSTSKTHSNSQRCRYCLGKIQKRFIGIYSFAITILLLTVEAIIEPNRFRYVPKPLWKHHVFYAGICLVGLLFLEMPYIRVKSSTVVEKMAKPVKVTIKWRSVINKGLFLARYMVNNDDIFPAYFFRDNALIINAACIVLYNIKWQGLLGCACTMKFVLDDIPDIVQDGDTFKIYHNKREIGTGVIVG